jgi:hypothetical protein
VKTLDLFAGIGGSHLDSNEQDSNPQGSLRLIHTASACSPSTGLVSRAGATSEPCDQLTFLPPISSAEDSPAPISAWPAKVQASTARTASSGSRWLESLATFDRDSLQWKTWQLCLDGELDEFSETWPRSGMIVSGIAYQLPPLEPLTDATGSGLLPTPAAISWPTPTAGDAQASGSRNGTTSKAHPGISLTDAVRGDGGTGRLWPTPTAKLGDPKRGMPHPPHAMRRMQSGRRNLDDAVVLWPTPAARDYRYPNTSPYSARGGGTKGEQLPNAVGGALNPVWTEWLMGYPTGWTDCGGSGTRSSRRSRR